MTSLWFSSGLARRSAAFGLAGGLTLLVRVAPCLAEETAGGPSASSGESEARRKAAALFARGREAFERGDYEAALVDLRASYELVPAPALLFNIAQALRLAGQCEEAAEQYRRYRDAGLELPSDFDDLVEQARRCAEEQRAKPNEGGAVAARDTTELRAASPSAAPSSRGEAPPPEPSHASASMARARAVAPESAQAAEGSYMRPVGVALFAVAAGSAALGTVFVVRANEAEAEVEGRSGTEGAWDEDGAKAQEEGRTSAHWAAGLYAVSAVAAGAGLWFWLSAPSNDAPHVAVSVAPSTLGLSTSVRASF